ncbi:MAG: hypothetical protein ABI318_15200 [Chthoniobacteraceae bacterium]
MNRLLIPSIIAALSAPALAQLNDIPPVDLKQVLQGLKQFKEQNETGLKTRRNNAYKQITTAAASNEAAAAFWTNAVLAVQFAGVDHQATAVRDWLKSEGEGLKASAGANAARLHLVWLGLTIQHAAGAETKQLLPTVVDFVRQLDADDAAIGHVVDQIDKAKERAGNSKVAVKTKAVEVGTQAKKMHDSILRMSVTSSPVAKSLQIADLLRDVAKKKKKGDDAEPATWETVPGNVNGIYNAIILPEFRATKDPRLLDYWDMMIRKGQENIYAGMPGFEERQWTQVKRPTLLWSRTQDLLLIGQRNRAITEMFNLIKAFPQHPEAASWITQLEQTIAALNPAPPAASILNNGGVGPPVAIPAATAPAAPPTAIIVPVTPAGVR